MQERIPILMGGSGERRTLRLVAQYADACNLFGDTATVGHKLEVLRRHCDDVGRDPAAIEVTHLSSALDCPVEDHVGRYRELAEAGVETAIVRFDTPRRGSDRRIRSRRRLVQLREWARSASIVQVKAGVMLGEGSHAFTVPNSCQ